MNNLLLHIGHALLMAFGMFWNVGWSLVLGFLISGFLQAFVSKEHMSNLLGGSGFREIALAAGFGAASSSCSYASASITRTLLQKGASFVASMAFLFASTNLVIELGIILYLLMGWQFVAGEWVGGFVLILIMNLLVRLTHPTKLIEEARQKASQFGGKHHPLHPISEVRFLQKLSTKETYISIAQNFTMDGLMLWKDLVIGFLMAGFLSEFVSQDAWHMLFVMKGTPINHIILNALIAPLIAMISFVCSIGNVPMAAVLWSSGVSFGGVLAFLYADLIVLPLLDVYRRYFGWKMAAYMLIIFYLTMVLSGIVMDLVFAGLGIEPRPHPDIKAHITHFAVDYTFWLNLTFGLLAIYVVILSKRKPPPMSADYCGHDKM